MRDAEQQDPSEEDAPYILSLLLTKIHKGEGAFMEDFLNNEDKKQDFGHCYIPSHIMEREDISPNQKLLYGCIIGLTGKKGYCYASNAWLGRRLKLKPNWISHLLIDLREKNLIKVNIVKNDTGQIVERRITVFVERGVLCENTRGIVENNKGGIVEKHNQKGIIINNNTRESNRVGKPQFSPPSIQEVSEYCKSRNNNIDANLFVDHYNSNGWMVGRTKMVDWKAAVRTWEQRDKKNGKSGSNVLKPEGGKYAGL